MLVFVQTAARLAQQFEALREHATQEGYEVLEEVMDAGQSGASLTAQAWTGSGT